MNVPRQLAGLTLVTIVLSLAVPAAQRATAPADLALTAEQMETFLLTARIVRMRPAGSGITDSRRATLTDGPLTHDAHVQVIDQFKAVFSSPEYAEVGFRDSYRYNVAAYRLARLLGIDNVPVSVVRSVDREPASLTWWIDDVMMDEAARRKTQARNPDTARGNDYQYRMRVFDELIQNRDRNLGNIVYTSDWTLWMIDHTRGFRLLRQLVSPEGLTRIERTLLENLRTLTPAAVEQALQSHLNRQERDALLARRDLIVKRFEDLIAARGESAVVYDVSR
jgi:hypothetical protein